MGRNLSSISSKPLVVSTGTILKSVPTVMHLKVTYSSPLPTVRRAAPPDKLRCGSPLSDPISPLRAAGHSGAGRGARECPAIQDRDRNWHHLPDRAPRGPTANQVLSVQTLKQMYTHISSLVNFQPSLVIYLTPVNVSMLYGPQSPASAFYLLSHTLPKTISFNHQGSTFISPSSLVNHSFPFPSSSLSPPIFLCHTSAPPYLSLSLPVI